jgi:hypothetical protein
MIIDSGGDTLSEEIGDLEFSVAFFMTNLSLTPRAPRWGKHRI